ncbi:MAG: 3-dehydroquinate synthase [Candidatus Daviesbacteria bacterium]|nr:3-dehydroquinate synthase [Candidatus Daviesbacteria bacterium]
MRKIKVHIKNGRDKNYPIFVGLELLGKINSLFNIAHYSKAVVVTDRNIPQSLVQNLQAILPITNSAVVLDGGEQKKDLDNVGKVWKTLKDFGCDRKSLIINLGGGVTGDIGGFAASTFMRGIDFLQIPTTLLAQVDASIGGKAGINFLGIKNLIGTFQHPIAVIADVDTLSTLPQREFISGFAEIIKHGLIADKNYFKLVTAKKPQDFSQNDLIEIIEKSCQIKAGIVSQDEKESGLRKILNFGHTIGHAIESLSQETDHPLLHGEAVSIGMITEGQISKMLGLLSEEEYKILEHSINQAGLPIKTFNIPVNKVLEKIKSDKKNEKGTIKWTLLQSIGKAIYNQKVDDSIVRKVL